MASSVTVSTGPVGIDEVVAVARRGASVAIAENSVRAIEAVRGHIEHLAASGRPVYGVSTGFGALATRYIDPGDRRRLQRSLIRSHAAGAGPAVEAEVVRAMMLLRLSTMCSGRTGVRVQTARAYEAMLNAHVTPVVPEFGSLGCSGDLAPLAHCALVAMGEGEALDASGAVVPAAEALRAAGIEPLELAEKEGLALINGTDGMLGMLALAAADLRELVTAADVAAAMTIEALLGTDRVMSGELQALRPHPGQAVSARNITRMLAGSGIVASHRDDDPRVQDAYSMRCAPQVAGAMRDTLAHAEEVATRELASTIDNPVVLPDGGVESNGNFHGAPVAYVLDFLAIAAADLASISERRTDRMLDRGRSQGLPAFLAEDPGVDSGYMIAQYTAAGLVTEMKRLAAPASVDSIPSSAMQEDHVSMGWHAGRKLLRSVDALRRVLAIEIMTAARALELRSPLAPAAATASVVAALRRRVPGLGPDRHLSPEIAAATGLLADGSLLAAAREGAGELE